MAISELLTNIKDIFLAGAAATTATVAVKGLNSWHRELRGKAEFQTAISLIKSTYRLRDEIWASRSHFISGAEFPKGYGSPGHKTAQQESEAWAHVFNNRWRPVRDALLDFESYLLEAEAFWGSNIRGKADELRQCARNLRVAMEAIIDDKAQGGENFRTDKEFCKTMRKIVFASRDEKDNPLTVKINNAIMGIEDISRPHLKRN
jgi:hypothetical protein